MPKKYYHGQIVSYLGKPFIDLREQSYNGALFWLYFTEQFASVKSEPHYGMDAMLKYWQKNKENKTNGISADGIETLDDVLADTDSSPPTAVSKTSSRISQSQTMPKTSSPTRHPPRCKNTTTSTTKPPVSTLAKFL